MPRVIGVDTGGTFTDTVIVADDGSRVTGEAETTPDDPARGVVDSLEVSTGNLGEPLSDVLAATDVLFHGTTRTTNTVLERTGSDVSLITTRGHRDALHVGRTMTRTTGLSREEARRIYGVVVTDEGDVDVDATEARREEIREERLTAAPWGGE